MWVGLKHWRKDNMLRGALTSIFNWISWFSLDVVAGALILLRFVSSDQIHKPDFNVYLALGISVWVIYTLDHLSDGLKNDKPSKTVHRVHKKFRKPITIALILAIFMGLLNLFWLPKEILLWGFGLGFFSLFYLKVSSILGKIGFKEAVIAISFGLGIYLFRLASGDTNILVLGDLILLTLVAFVNLLIISVYEADHDIRDRTYSIVQNIGVDFTKKTAKCICVLIAISVAAILYFEGIREISVFHLFAAGTYLVLLHQESIFRRKNLYKYLGDGVFLMPIIF